MKSMRRTNRVGSRLIKRCLQEEASLSHRRCRTSNLLIEPDSKPTTRPGGGENKGLMRKMNGKVTRDVWVVKWNQARQLLTADKIPILTSKPTSHLFQISLPHLWMQDKKIQSFEPSQHRWGRNSNHKQPESNQGWSRIQWKISRAGRAKNLLTNRRSRCIVKLPTFNTTCSWAIWESRISNYETDKNST